MNDEAKKLREEGRVCQNNGCNRPASKIIYNSRGVRSYRCADCWKRIKR